MTRDICPFNSSFTLFIQSLVMTRYVILFLYKAIKSSTPVLSLFMKHLKTLLFMSPVYVIIYVINIRFFGGETVIILTETLSYMDLENSDIMRIVSHDVVAFAAEIF